MMKKFFKIATMCSLVLSLSTANSAYATEPEPNTVSPSGTFNTDDNRWAQITISGNILEQSEQQYAVDIFADKHLTFHYQAINDYDPDTLTSSYGVSERSKGLLGSDAADTDSKVHTAARDYVHALDGLVSDPDTNVEGAWYGFDGVNNRIVVLNRSPGDVTMTATSSSNDVELKSTGYPSTAQINLYLNGDDLADDAEANGTSGHLYAYQKRKLDLTSAKSISGEGASELAGELLYDATALSNTDPYTDAFSTMLSYPQAFSTKENDTEGGHFSANPEQVVGAGDSLASGNINAANYSAVIQTSDSTAEPAVVANNFVDIAGYSSHTVEDDVHHDVGYALVYFDITGKPFDCPIDAYAEQGLVNALTGASVTNEAVKIGTITLSFAKKS